MKGSVGPIVYIYSSFKSSMLNSKLQSNTSNAYFSCVTKDYWGYILTRYFCSNGLLQDQIGFFLNNIFKK